MKTYSKKASEVNRGWTLIDASEAPLGRIATVIATRLTGKYKPTFTPNIDDGDYVVVINAEKLIVTGDKETAKTYYNYSGFPGGMKTTSLADVRKTDASKAVIAAVKGMLPKNKLAADRLGRLRVFNGEAHSHEAQKPVKVEVK
jgi:large subunit ribosomal protein L13